MLEIPEFMERKRFNFSEIEPRIREYWKKERIYAINKDIDPLTTKIIDTPPPYANGQLHHGHGMSYSQLDIIARYLRQRSQVILPLSFDDNGLPTERFTEIKYGIEPGSHPADFFQLCREEAENAIKAQIDQFERIGFSYDHQIAYTTIDERSTRITQLDFIQLYKKGLIEYQLEPQLFCPRCQTALAQADLESETKDTTLYYIKFLTTSKDSDPLIIATTRPELIPAATAIFYHPEDNRYNSLNLTLLNPITGEDLELYPDNSIDPEFGSGLMMVATFGDQQDILLYRKHRLKLHPILGSDGRFKAPDLIKNNSIKDARQIILEELRIKDFLIDKEEITHTYPECERCSTPIEIINTKQWSIDLLSIKEELLEFIQDLDITPSYMKKRLINWIKGLKWNWIISRQRFYGIPIPAWHCTICDSIKLGDERDLPITQDTIFSINKMCLNCDIKMEPNGDIFDTWMTSSLTPRILADYYLEQGLEQPLELRSQAHEIIRTWAFYSILKQYLTGAKPFLPWKHLLISGWGLGFKNKGKRGIKASKSSGTGFDPIELIDEYGADAFRYWAAQARLGKDQYLKDADLNRGGKLITKMYNAAKITLILAKEATDRFKEEHSNNNIAGIPIDNYIQEKSEHLESLRDQYEQLMENFNYTDALDLIEHDFWDDYCSTWIEEIKNFSKESSITRNLSNNLIAWFQIYLQLFAPILPFITEYLNMIIWKFQYANTSYRSIHIQSQQISAINQLQEQ